MKKLKATVTKKDGTTKEVYVIVDNQTAEMLALLDDKKMVNDYLVDEYKMFMADRYHHRHAQSLDSSLEGGFEIEDKKQDVLESIMVEAEHQEIKDAIKQLQPQQQWLIEQVFFEQRKKTDIAKELGISAPAISDRLEKIMRRLKKILQ